MIRMLKLNDETKETSQDSTFFLANLWSKSGILILSVFLEVMMGLVLPTDCLLRWKSSCDSRYPCFFQMVTCIIAYEGPILSWIFGRFGWVWIYVSVGVYVFVFFGIFFNILHLTEPWNLNEQRLPKKGLISSCSIPKHLLHALDIKETWQNTSLDARFLVSLDVFGWHVFFQGLQWQLICELLEAGVWFWISTSWSRMDQQRCLPKANQFPMDLPMECLRRAGNSRAFEQGLECL